MKRFFLSCVNGVINLLRLVVQCGSIMALTFAALLLVQIKLDVCELENASEGYHEKVVAALDEVACVGKVQDHIAAAQDYARDCSEVASLEAYRSYFTDIELQETCGENNKLRNELNKQATINRSMRVYIERLHRLLRDNNVAIPAQQMRPVGG